MIKRIAIPYFPKGFKYATPVILGLAVYLAFLSYFIWTFTLLLLIVLILTTRYITQIDMTERRYSDYLSLLGLRLNNESKKFQTLDRIVITKGEFTKKVYSRLQDRTLQWTDFTATLVFDHNQTLPLLTLASKKKLVMGLKDFAAFLGVGVEDRTTPASYWIDLQRV